MSTQIVFLIDLNQQQDTQEQAPSISDSICLTSLRLLHFLSSKNEKRGYAKKAKQSHTTVKWGYTFFTTKTHVSKFEQQKFKDFKLKHFEEYECEVHRRLESLRQICTSQNSSKKPASISNPVDCTKRALTEVLSDFPWEKPDMMSPVRKRSAKQINKHKLRNNRNNFVVVFSTCPKNVGEMKFFTGRKVPDDEVFLDSLLPPSLFQQFCKLSRLSLSWCDTHHLVTSADNDVVKIVQDALLKTGGNLFHINSVAQTFGTESCQQSESSFYCRRGLLPFTALLDNYMLPGTAATNSSGQFKATFELDNDLVCNVSISPSVNSSERSPVPPDVTDISAQTANTAVISYSTQLADTVWRQYGVISRRAFGNRPQSRVLVCSGCRQTGHTTDVFYTLLKELQVKNKLLLLLCKQSGDLAVLQPLTDHSAVLSLVPDVDLLTVEKLLLPGTSRDDVGVVKSTRTDDLITRLIANKNYSKRAGLAVYSGAGGDCVGVDCPTLDRWQVPGCKPALTSLIDKLNDRISELDFLSADEAGQLRLLQKAYKSENKPPGLRDTTGDNHEGNQSLLEESRDDGNQQLEPGAKCGSRKGGKATVSRGKMIYDLCRSKETEKGKGRVEKEGGESGQTRPDKATAEVPAQLCDFSSPDDLKVYLTSNYAKVVSGEVCGIETSIQTFSTVVLHYMKQTGCPDPEKAAAALLEDCLLETGVKLREKYATRTDDGCKQEKITEFQCQVLLRLEIMSSLVGKDQTLGEDDTNDEIVGLLRALSFVGEPGLLPDFLQSCLLPNYIHTLPRTLANIYDELMQPLPDSLACILSPTSSADQSILNTSLTDYIDPPSSRTRSHLSVGPGSNCSMTGGVTGPRQKGSRKLVHHPSLADFGPKRQIFVEKLPKQKDKSSRKKEKEHSSKRSRDKVSKNLFDRGRRGGVKLERRQSVAVMERNKTPKKTKSKLLAKSPASRMMSPRRRRLVAETPCHKQVSQALWHTQNMRRHSLAAEVIAEVTTEVIAESPVKDMKATSLKDTPTKAKRAKALLRRSFYSAGPINRTRNLTQYFQLADKIAGRKRYTSITTDEKKPKKLLSMEPMEGFQSPNKNSSFLLSQLISSPSPAKLTPRKLNMTPCKLPPDSPSMNTRLKSTGVFQSPSSILLLSPVSRRQSRAVLVTDSEAKKVDISPTRTPEKSPVSVCGTISAGLDSPSQNTRLKVSATPTRKSVRAALFAKSPAANRYQSPHRSIGTASPRELISRFSSPQKQASPRKQVWSNEIPAYMSPRKTLSNEVSAFISPRKSTSEGLKEKGFSSVQMSTKLSQLTSAGPSADIASDRNNKTSETLNTFKNVELRPLTISSLAESVSNDSTCTIKSTNSKQMTVQRTPSPKKKTKAKTPESFDKWHRRKPRVTQHSPSVKRFIQNSTVSDNTECVKTLESCCNINIQSPGKSAIHTRHNSLIGDADREITKPVFSPISKKRNLHLSPESILSPRKRRRTNTTDLDTVSGKPESICDMNTKQNTHSPSKSIPVASGKNDGLLLKTISSPKGRKRTLLLSPEAFMSPSKRQRTHQANILHSLSEESSFPLGSQGFDVTGTFSQSSQISNTSSLGYFSTTNDDVFLTQETDPSSQTENQPALLDTDDIENNDSLLMGRLTRKNSATRKQTLKVIKTNSMDEIAERSDSPIFGGKGTKRHRNPSQENGKLLSILENVDRQNYTGTVSETRSPRIKNSPACKSTSVASSPTLTISPGSKKYSPVVSAKSLMHLIQSPLLNSSAKEGKNSPGGSRTIAPGERSRRSLKLQNM